MMETPDQVPYLIADYQKALREGGQQLLSTCGARVRETGLEPETKMRTIETLDQHVYDAVAEEAKRWPADLIVIGTHGRRGFRRLMLGSVAEGLARVATLPVLLVHKSRSRGHRGGQSSKWRRARLCVPHAWSAAWGPHSDQGVSSMSMPSKV